MRAAAIFAAAFGCAVVCVQAQEPAQPSGRRAARPNLPDWEFATTGYWNAPRGGDDYGSAILAANRGPLHLEARFNYEAVHAQSAFVGWTFSGGKGVEWEFTPILGAVTGATKGPIAGFEGSIAGDRWDFYIEAEYVRDRSDETSSYTYAWSELGFRPAPWLRVGLVAQRTRAFGGDRDLQRGGLAQFTHGSFTLGAYWFNPGSSDQVVIVSVGATF
ncbi:hypothetical protein [Usitatibacter palustris]|uniref:Cellulose biosynthesis protein BcsS n=1 Tax=Usitatibacter palustris TaxID=2732487 RepID=A0A6M4H2C8_9PROT|nr:hypothetical protein [Usitatibacter palustris]QJR13646.1 hypothetical protein DSM104440_00431 [Usitatibacter palustris]